MLALAFAFTFSFHTCVTVQRRRERATELARCELYCKSYPTVWQQKYLIVAVQPGAGETLSPSPSSRPAGVLQPASLFPS